eukprot:1854609-Rhodomonas_salina.2
MARATAAISPLRLGERVRGLIQTLIPCHPPVRLVDEVALAVNHGRDPAIVEGAFKVRRESRAACYDTELP